MACFIVPAAEAVVVKIVEKSAAKKEKTAAAEHEEDRQTEEKIPLSVKLKWLSRMLWGGVILLLFEHIWHGEVVPWFPFLTAMSDSEDAIEMFKEMATVGVTMAVLVTAVWFVMCKVADSLMKRPVEEPEKEAV